jgi:hypothetical protein
MVWLARLRFGCARAGCAVLLAALLAAPALASSTVYKWVDEYGTVHLSTSKPPAGVQYQTLNIGSTSSSSSRPASGSSAVAAKKPPPPASPQLLAQRSEVLSSLQTRECVLALETLDRLTSGTKPTSATELARLKQTAELNCSKDPARRREQEQMAARLRVANSPECVSARNQLADMMAPGSRTPRVQVQSQQAFVDDHCTPPVQ